MNDNRSNNFFSLVFLFFLTFLFPLFSCKHALALDYTWIDQSGGSFSWENESFWDSGDGTPGNDGYPDDNSDKATIDVSADNISTAGAITVGEVNIGGTYSGTVTFGGTLTIDDAGTQNGNLTINAGTVNHLDNSTAETNKLVITVDGAFTLGASGTIDVDGLGYDGNNGPGNPTATDDGGSYGGLGGDDGQQVPSSTTYGSITAPTNIGSGSSSTTGEGGGAVQITVTGATTLNGTIRADGSVNGRAGSGGSIFLTTGTISGSGTLRAHGGSPTSSSFTAGGGGRISVVLTTTDADFSGFSGAMTAYGGDSPRTNGDGAAGTVYQEEEADTADQGTLIIDNNNLTTGTGVNTLMASAVTVQNFSEIIIRNDGNLGVDSDDTFQLGGTTITGEGRDEAIITIVDSTGVTSVATFSLAGYTLQLNTALSVTGDWIVTSTGRIAHGDNRSAETFSINLTITGDLTVDASGEINVDGLGYDATQGPGKGGETNDGGGYGGLGGDDAGGTPNSGTYGSITAPTNIGSGSGFVAGSGGGAVQLTVSGATTINGTISADGDAPGGRAGSGGSVYITTGTISGSGTVQANGAATTSVGAGGGGRVAVILTTTDADFSGFSGSMRAYGGDSASGSRDGAAGTVYQQTQAQGSNGGELIIDNNNLTVGTGVVTDMDSEDAESATVGSLTLSNGGVFFIGSGDSLTVGGTGTTVTINTGTTLNNEGTLSLNGTTFTLDGTFTANADTSSVTYTGQSDDTAVTLMGTTYDSLTVNNASTTFNQGGAVTVEDTLTITNGTYDLNGNALTATGATIANNDTFQLQGGETVTGLTMDTDSGTTIYDGSGTYASGLAAGDAYNALTFSGSGSWTLDATLDVNSVFTLAAGTVNDGGQNITVAGNWANTGGTLSGTGTVTLDGTSQTISGSTTFYNLTKNVSTADTLTFTSGTTQTISNTMNLQGASGQLLSLRSSSSGTQWNINPQGTRTIAFLDVQDSNNTNGTSISTSGFNITDSGNNTGWTFVTSFLLSASSPQVTGSEFTLTITALDPNGATATGFSGTVNLTNNYVSPLSGSGALSVTSVSSWTEGVATVTNESFSNCGTITITATKSDDSSINGTSSSLVFAPSTFVVTPSSLDNSSSSLQAVNKNFTLEVRARNAGAGTCTDYPGTATLTVNDVSPSSDQDGSLSTTSLTSTNFSSGVATITNMTYDKWGTVTITAADATRAASTGTSSNITFVPKDFSVTLTDPPASRDFYYVNEDFSTTVTARDNNNAAISNYAGTISFSGDSLNLPDNYTFTSSDAGVHTFTETSGSAEATATMTVADTTHTTVTGSSSSFSIKEGTVKVIATAGPVGPITVQVQILDKNGNVITEDNSTTFVVALTEFFADSDSATSSATASAVTVTNGVATFVLENTEAETITVTPTSSPILTPVSGDIRFGTVSGTGVGIDMWREIK